ncbi:MAG: rhodanese-like domain-containing protein [Rickettsiaceae bacterium]|nr:MAG: rhodanese-like domain-containing protein [Rickettsiaceae bacterium]
MFVKNIVSTQAADILKLTKLARLIDVRSKSEWQNYGFPLYDSYKLLLLSWRIYPYMEINSSFEQIINLQIQNKKETLFFICKSGLRSLEAAECVKNMGYSNCYNIVDGTEGNFSGKGWKYNNLPWQNF